MLANKSSWSLLGHLCLAIGRHGKPKATRTDNESSFTSRVFSAGLASFGIRHQRTDVGCPWQNGRIERFFVTLAQALDQARAVPLALGGFGEECKSLCISRPRIWISRRIANDFADSAYKNYAIDCVYS